MQADIEDRIAQLRQAMTRKDIDTLLVLVGENRRYLSGYTGEDTLFDESAGALLISAQRLLLATDSRYDLQAAVEAPGFEVHRYERGLAAALPSLLADFGTRRLGFESVRLTVGQYEEFRRKLDEQQAPVELVATEGLVENLRIIKSPDEIEHTRAALAMAEAAFLQVLETLKPGQTERAVAWEMEKRLREAGAEGLSFPIIVAAGPNSARPHAVPGDRVLERGEPILFDWGVRLSGYCSDISRTVVLGRPDATFRKVYQAVHDAQRLATAAIRPGARTREVDRVARDHIRSKGFAGRFGHGLGHGTGLAIHEAPRLSPLKDTPLQTGMLFTVEPGIYLPEWGGVRLENMVYVGEDGAVELNTLGFDDYVIAL